MKISKLFHWLYGILMLLPIFAVGVKSAYVVFNPNAFESYTGNYSYEATKNILTYLQTSENNTIEQNIVSNHTTYRITNMQLIGDTYTNPNASHTGSSKLLINVDNFIDLVNNENDYTDVKSILITNQNDSNPKIYTFNTRFNYNTMYFDTATSTRYGLYDSNGIEITRSSTAISFTYLKFTNISNEFYYVWGYTNASILEKDIFYIDTTLSSVFYSAIQELDSVSFFSWAKDSFIAQPFLYIGNLFGITNTHPIFTLLSYWTAISVIWLVFDIILYVPLLAHRWLDKGRLD